MRKIKLTAVLLVISTLCLLLVSCHGGKGNNETFVTPMSFDESRTYEITFWAKNENNASQREVYDNAIKDFEKIYPNIKVSIKHYTDYGAIYNDVITNIQTSTTPNICITYPDHIATYKEGENVVVSLDALARDEKYGFGGSEIKFESAKKEEIVSKFLSECYIDGELYALPFMRSTEAVYVNKTLLNSLGYELPDVLTWDFIFEVSNAALALGKETVKDDKGKDVTIYKANGKTVLKPVIYKSTDNMMIQMLAQKDAGYSNSKGEILLFNSTAKDLLYMIRDNTATGAFSTFKIDSYPGNFLNRGECIFAIDSTAGSTWMGSDAPLMDVHSSLVSDFETAVRPVPQFNTEEPEMISQGPSLCIFNKADPNEVMASWIFAQYLLSNDVQIAYSQTEGYAPVTAKAQSSAEFTDYLSRSGQDNELYYDVKIDAVKMLIENTDNTFVTPVFNGSTSLRDAAGQMIENVTRSVKRKQTVDDAYVEKLYNDMISLYKLENIVSEEEAKANSELKLQPISIMLLIGIGAAWLAILSYICVNYVKNNRRRVKIDKKIGEN